MSVGASSLDWLWSVGRLLAGPQRPVPEQTVVSLWYKGRRFIVVGWSIVLMNSAVVPFGALIYRMFRGRV